jgi:hypothetical protein
MTGVLAVSLSNLIGGKAYKTSSWHLLSRAACIRCGFVGRCASKALLNELHWLPSLKVELTEQQQHQVQSSAI